MFYFLNKIACCLTLQSSCLSELIEPLKIEPSSGQVPIKTLWYQVTFGFKQTVHFCYQSTPQTQASAET